MNKKAMIGAAMGIVVALAAVFASGMKKDRGEQVATGQPVAEETKPLGIPVSANAAAPDVALPVGDTSAEVYEKLIKEVEALSQQAMSQTSPEEQMRIFGEMQALLLAFRAKYPDTPESLDAGFQLGAMNYSVQYYGEAQKYLNEFVSKAPASERQKMAYAHFYLAEAYKGDGKYDEAEKEYKTVLSEYSNVNPRLTQFVQNNMAMLGTERKTAVGGEPLPFTVTSLTGEKLSPEQYRGKVLLIDFWATWCGPCIAEMPNVKRVYDKYHGKGFEIVGISLDQSRDRLDAYIEQNNIQWPQYFDGKWWNNDVATIYGIKSIPATLLVDRDGKIRYKSLRGKQLESAVEKLVAESS
jgi:thiol-disulfide isomerase/thioredoxin